MQISRRVAFFHGSCHDWGTGPINSTFLSSIITGLPRQRYHIGEDLVLSSQEALQSLLPSAVRILSAQTLWHIY